MIIIRYPPFFCYLNNPHYTICQDTNIKDILTLDVR